MKTGPIVLGALLALSLLFNIVAFVRLQDREEPKAALAAPPLRPARPQPAPAEPLPSMPTPAAPAAPKAVAPLAAPPAAPRSAVQDPQVLGVLEAQDDFNAVWKELDRVFKARSKMDEATYARTVTSALEDFLGLPEASRPAFSAALKAGAAEYAAARAERDAAKNALPPKTEVALYQQQKNAVDQRCQDRVQRAVDGVKAHLDPRQPRHAELGHNVEKLLKNLTPR